MSQITRVTSLSDTNNYLPLIIFLSILGTRIIHLLLLTSSGCIIKLCKVSTVSVHLLRRCYAYILTDRQGDSYIQTQFFSWGIIITDIPLGFVSWRVLPRWPLVNSPPTSHNPPLTSVWTLHQQPPLVCMLCVYTWACESYKGR